MTINVVRPPRTSVPTDVPRSRMWKNRSIADSDAAAWVGLAAWASTLVAIASPSLKVGDNPSGACVPTQESAGCAELLDQPLQDSPQLRSPLQGGAQTLDVLLPHDQWAALKAAVVAVVAEPNAERARRLALGVLQQLKARLVVLAARRRFFRDLARAPVQAERSRHPSDCRPATGSLLFHVVTPAS